ncbi:hypothetical protein C8C99_0289 [Acidovorax sp. 107]|nr:hypothetical protein C8C99_0289 [Acidovorax sp. 107]
MWGMNVAATEIIDRLGGTAKVSRMFGISMPSVSDWKHDGIPHARVMFLRAAHRKTLAGCDLDAATAPRKAEATQTA